jgi:trimeric autotransporter adhesin
VAADRTALARGCVLAATLLVACVDGPTSPGRFGELRIRPTYEAGDAPSTIGLAVDSARVRVARPGDAATPLVDTTVAYTSDTASLGWFLELLADEETVRVDVEIWSGGAPAWSGDHMALVRDGAIARAMVAPVTVAYVGPVIVATAAVSPDTVTLEAFGDTAMLTGEARDRHAAVVEAAFAWASDDAAVASVDPATGVVTAVGNGTTTVHGVAGAAHDSATIVVAQRASAVSVTPATATLSSLGATQPFAAVAVDRNGSAVATASIVWTSSDPAVVSVDPATGVATAVAGGSATITAASGAVEGTALVTVDPTEDVASIVVTPASAEFNSVGATQQFTAVARDAGGGVLAGVHFTWETADTAVASIDPLTGVASATGHGSTTVTATAGAASGSATLSVDLAPTVASIEVAPDGATLTAPGATQQFTAVARDASGAVVPGMAFVWTSAAPAVARVDAGTGLATAAAHGETTIAASAGGIAGIATLTVDLTALVASVVVAPDAAELTALGATQQFTAEARDASGAVVPVAAFAWSSALPDVATVDAVSGVATATGHGATTISATVGGVSGHAALTVDLAQAVASIEVAPDGATLTAPGATQQFTAVARDASGAVVPGMAFVWTSAAPAVARVDAGTGLATAAAHGETTIAASAGGIAGIATLTVDLTALVASVVVAPDAAELTALGATQQFTAEARDASGAVVPGMAFVWTSSAPAVATVDAGTGLATANANGVTTLTATAGSVSATATLAVTQRVARVAVTPDSATLTGQFVTLQFTAEAFDANDRLVTGVTFSWSSSDESVAKVDTTGLAISRGMGTATIQATTSGVSGSAVLRVE